MGQKAKKDEIYFNYPIPKEIHRQVKQLQLDTGMSVKNIVISALKMYVEQQNREEIGEDL